MTPESLRFLGRHLVVVDSFDHNTGLSDLDQVWVEQLTVVKVFTFARRVVLVATSPRLVAIVKRTRFVLLLFTLLLGGSHESTLSFEDARQTFASSAFCSGDPAHMLIKAR